MNKTIREVLENMFRKSFGLPNNQVLDVIDIDIIDQALSEIEKIILPENKMPPSGSCEDKYGYLAGQRKGYNDCREDIRARMGC